MILDGFVMVLGLSCVLSMTSGGSPWLFKCCLMKYQPLYDFNMKPKLQETHVDGGVAMMMMMIWLRKTYNEMVDLG